MQQSIKVRRFENIAHIDRRMIQFDTNPFGTNGCQYSQDPTANDRHVCQIDDEVLAFMVSDQLEQLLSDVVYLITQEMLAVKTDDRQLTGFKSVKQILIHGNITPRKFSTTETNTSET